MKRAKKLAIAAAAVVLGAFLLFERAIYVELLRNGYGLRELPGTTAVVLHLKRAYTVKSRSHSDGGVNSVFIGYPKDDYEDALLKKGYYKVGGLEFVDFYSPDPDKKYTGNTNIDYEYCYFKDPVLFSVYYMYSPEGNIIEDFV